MLHKKIGFHALLLALCLLAARGAGWSQEHEHCGSGERLVPTFDGKGYPRYNDYDPNATQFDAVCLPEAWEFMTSRWQGPQVGIGSWPYLVVIDDGFFTNQDSPVRPEIHPGYPDGTGLPPDGTAWGDPNTPALYGYHGTAVLSLLSSTANNAFLISGICGDWDNVSGGQSWGARFLPVRLGKGLLAFPSPSLLTQIFKDVVLRYPEARVVNLSKSLVNLNLPAGSDLENVLLDANAQQVVVVTGAGNTRGNVKSTDWVRNFENVIVVGALNPAGTDLWIDNSTTGTATGDGVDLYAPGQDLTMVIEWTTTAQDSGTSYAAPFVSGVVAMMQNIDPTLDSWEVRSILVETGDLVTPSTGGPAVRRLNAYRALRCVEALNRWTSWGNPPVRYWDCHMGSLGSASGSRVGY